MKDGLDVLWWELIAREWESSVRDRNRAYFTALAAVTDELVWMPSGVEWPAKEAMAAAIQEGRRR